MFSRFSDQHCNSLCSFKVVFVSLLDLGQADTGSPKMVLVGANNASAVVFGPKLVGPFKVILAGSD